MSSRVTTPDFAIQPPAPPPPPRRRWKWWIAGAVLILAAAGAGAWYSTRRLPPIDSAAVAPFTAADGNTSDWLARGISGEVADQLERAPAFHVAPDASSAP